MPGGDILITERSGTLKRLSPDSGELRDIGGLPAVHYKGQGGLLDVALHPRFENEPWLYLTYSAPLGEERSATRLARGRLEGDELVELATLYTTDVIDKSHKHYGSRLLFDGDYLYMTMGERGQRHRSQDLDSDLGKESCREKEAG